MTPMEDTRLHRWSSTLLTGYTLMTRIPLLLSVPVSHCNIRQSCGVAYRHEMLTESEEKVIASQKGLWKRIMIPPSLEML